MAPEGARSRRNDIRRRIMLPGYRYIQNVIHIMARSSTKCPMTPDRREIQSRKKESAGLDADAKGEGKELWG